MSWAPRHSRLGLKPTDGITDRGSLAARKTPARRKARTRFCLLAHALAVAVLCVVLVRRLASTSWRELSLQPDEHEDASVAGTLWARAQRAAVEEARLAAERRPDAAQALQRLYNKILQVDMFGVQEDGFNFERSQVCPLLQGKRVAFIGNGPMNKRQHIKSNSADVVVRFNALNSWEPGDKTDIWVIRHQPSPGGWPVVGYSVPVFQWAKRPGCLERVMEVGQSAQQFWLLMMAGWDELAMQRQERLAAYFNTTGSDPRLRRIWGVPFGVAFQEAVQEYLGKKVLAMPTTGLAVLVTILQCQPSRLEIYGSNWADTWWGHEMQVERGLVADLAARKVLHVYLTPCENVRHCFGKEPPEVVGICPIEMTLVGAPQPAPEPAPQAANDSQAQGAAQAEGIGTTV